MTIELIIPASKYGWFKGMVMSRFYLGNDPVLIRHTKMATEDFEYCSFSSDRVEDLAWVLGNLPAGSCHIPDYYFEWKRRAK